MSLTKEECEIALDILKKQHDYLRFNMRSNYPFSINMIENVQDCFKNLIEEHFDNSPLKFEELKLYIPFWDKKENEWCYFTTLNNNGSGVKISINEFPYIQAFIFEENRFYRKQVEDND